MGQPLPLPERIPRPSVIVELELKKYNIIVEDNEKEAYLPYKLPSGFRMVDDSWREDLPVFHIVNQNNLILFTIRGSWKGSYDNHITIHVASGSDIFVPKSEPLEKSETSGIVMMGNILQAVDPQHRPPTDFSVSRKNDYSS